MVSSKVILTIAFLTILGYEEVRSQSQNGESPNVDQQAQGGGDKEKNVCCTIPTFKDNQYYDSVACGYICSKNVDRSFGSKYVTTPGYALRKHYLQDNCYFGTCMTFQVSCQSCPDPSLPGFSIYRVRRTCSKCYYMY